MKANVEYIYLKIINLLDNLTEIKDRDALTALEMLKFHLLATLLKVKENENLGSRYNGTTNG